MSEDVEAPAETEKQHYDLTEWDPEKLIAEIHRLRERVHSVAAEADKRAAGWQRSVEETRNLAEWAANQFEANGLGRWTGQSMLLRHWVISLARQRDSALASIASQVVELTAETEKELAEVKKVALRKSRIWSGRFTTLIETLRLSSIGTTWPDVEAEVLRLRNAHDDHLNAKTQGELYRKEIREALGLPEGTNWHTLIGAVAHLVELTGPEGPCSTCHAGWVVDENWSPEYPGEWDGTRTPEHGVIPCGFCSHGDWTKPWPPEDGWDGSD